MVSLEEVKKYFEFLAVVGVGILGSPGPGASGGLGECLKWGLAGRVHAESAPATLQAHQRARSRLPSGCVQGPESFNPASKSIKDWTAPSF